MGAPGAWADGTLPWYEPCTCTVLVIVFTLCKPAGSGFCTTPTPPDWPVRPEMGNWTTRLDSGPASGGAVCAFSAAQAATAQTAAARTTILNMNSPSFHDGERHGGMSMAVVTHHTKLKPMDECDLLPPNGALGG